MLDIGYKYAKYIEYKYYKQILQVFLLYAYHIRKYRFKFGNKFFHNN